jgi:aflatoxin B1 aldehyde reductase
MYLDRYWHEQTFLAIETLKSVAQKSDRSLISLSLNWLMHHTGVDCVILGASKLEQLKQNLAVLDEGPLLPEALEMCDQAWRDLRGPTPIYNR